MDKTVKVKIGLDGSVEVKTEGFTGSECKDATKVLESALGKVNSDTPTSEMYGVPQRQNQEAR
jgi:hypothetical protein